MAMINPLETAQAVEDTYAIYLKSLIKPRNEKIFNALNDAIQGSVASDEGIVKGPFLEASPPYQAGKCIEDLIVEGVLSAEFRELKSQSLPLTRPLYAHQEAAIRKVAAGRNILVATGTGSGKTESFLLPILNSLMKEKEAGTLGPGVRALLLYPMNALANDQVKRIRELLEDYSDITFGRYTGETPASEKVAAQNYLAKEGKKHRKNELISREVMRETPPNILLTNYAMLEYLLLRPDDVPLFEGAGQDTWRFIVADEAHTYDGAHGIEVATLLRKLRERISTKNKIQTIGTTATIGGTDEEIQRFAENFFDNEHLIDSSEGAESDLVKPARKPIASPTWGPMSPQDWNNFQSKNDFIEATCQGNESQAFSKFQEESGVAKLRNTLWEVPRSVSECANAVFGNDDPDSQTAIARMVEIGAGISDDSGNPALSARFHMFARATEGIFGCLSPAPHLSLNRHTQCDVCDAVALELAGCNRCGAHYFIGFPEAKDDSLFFRPEISGVKPQYLMFENVEVPDGDEEEELEPIDGQKLARLGDLVDVQYVCTSCCKFSAQPFDCTDCASGQVMKAFAVKERTACVACSGKGRRMLRKLESGNDAAASVLASELYLHMPPSSDDQASHLPGEGRKLMVFSDNRQQAAYFAPYVESRFEKILWRKLVFQALKLATADNPGVKITPGDLTNYCVNFANHSNIFSPTTIPIIEKRQFADTRLHFEIVNTEAQNNLEGIGLTRVDYDLPENESGYAMFVDQGFSTQEAKLIVSELLNTLRLSSIVKPANGIALDSELFAPRNGDFSVRGEVREPRQKISAWSPNVEKGGSNSRLDYIKRVLESKSDQPDEKLTRELAADLLKKVWQALTVGQLKSLLEQSTINGNARYQLRRESIHLSLVGDADLIFECSSCGRVTPRSLNGVCPRFKCRGNLVSNLHQTKSKGEFYRRQFDDSHFISMAAREHTAQLTSEEASDVQKDFIRGKVNLLSSSTTFELGVDVGELQSVFMRNIPPSVANYLQRAGRAGRRADSAALILSYAQRKPHDLSKYASPVSMVAGKMRSPFVELSNERILQRHVYSVFFAAYFKEQGIKSNIKAGEFFIDGSPNSFAELMPAWVDSNSAKLRGRFDALIPEELVSKAELIWSNTKDDFNKLIVNVQKMFSAEVQEYSDLIDAAIAQGSKGLGAAAKLAKIRDNVVGKDIISFLSKSNLIPKYGFPVDTVELKPGRSDSNSSKVELDRDLSIAIFEYQPGATVIAAGFDWTSVGLGYVPNKGLRQMQYSQCQSCDYYNEQIASEASRLTTCASCGTMLTKVFEYLIPEWGFVARGGSKKPSDMVQTGYSGRRLFLASTGQAQLLDGPKTPGKRVKAELRLIADLVLINAGLSDSGFYVCPFCKASAPVSSGKMDKHARANNADVVCNKDFVNERYHLGHKYQSDIVHIKIDLSKADIDAKQVANATAYALLQGASNGLQISHDDLDVIVLPSDENSLTIALVDAVPAGAGFAKMIAENLKTVFESAFEIVSSCQCGEETSCYECLRTYRNQRMHEDLVRGDALAALKVVLNK